MSGSSGTAAALAAVNGIQASPVEEDEQQAVLALAAVAAQAQAQHLRPPDGSPPAPLRSRSRSLGSGGGNISALSEEGTDDLNDGQDAGNGLMGRRHSGSLSTLDPSDWRAGDSLPLLMVPHAAQQQQQQQGYMRGQGQGQLALMAQQQQQQYLSMQQQQQQHTQAQAMQQGQGGEAPASRGRRNARQQEQNKQAQQRYRAKRKAQFEELQRKVAQMSSEVAAAQRHRHENEKLRLEVSKLKTMLQAASAAGAAAAAPLAAAAVAAAGSADALPAPAPAPTKLESQVSLPDLLGMPQPRQQAQQQQQQPPSELSPGTGTGAGPRKQQQFPGGGGTVIGGSGAFKPTATARPLAPATLAELPQPAAAARRPLASAIATLAPAQPQQPLPPPSGRQVHAALDLYYQDLQSFATTVKLERVPTDGTGLGAESAQKLTELVRTGVELVKMVLQTSGPDAAALLTAGMPSMGADGCSPADSLAQWRMVAARVGLSPEQHLLLADWRRRFLQKLDDCYGRRLLHKAQLAQLPAGGATISMGGLPNGGAAGGAAALALHVAQQQQPQWVEALLLQAAESVGFSACALACAQLEGVVAALGDNLREERSTACAMMAELLDLVLTKVQAARFLLAGHPFCWNGLSFSLAAASLAPGTSVTVKQEQPPLSELLARMQSATG